KIVRRLDHVSVSDQHSPGARQIPSFLLRCTEKVSGSGLGYAEVQSRLSRGVCLECLPVSKISCTEQSHGTARPSIIECKIEYALAYCGRTKPEAVSTEPRQ